MVVYCRALEVDLLDVLREEGSQCSADVAHDVSIDISQLPLVKRPNGESVLSMYWIDAFEDHFKHPGNLCHFLFDT